MIENISELGLFDFVIVFIIFPIVWKTLICLGCRFTYIDHGNIGFDDY